MATRIGPFCCFATGLGLVAYDAGLADELEDGPGFGHALGRHPERVEAALAQGRAVMLTVGDPQRDYLVQVFDTPAPPEAPETLAAAAAFPLRVPSGALCLRDAYDLMDWEGGALHVIRVPVPPGGYVVEVLRLEEANGLCVLHLHLTPADELPEGAGWVDLFD